MCSIFAIQLNISFVLGNVYFDVNSWGKRYGVLTAVNPDTQDEAGKFMAWACLNAFCIYMQTFVQQSETVF